MEKRRHRDSARALARLHQYCRLSLTRIATTRKMALDESLPPLLHRCLSRLDRNTYIGPVSWRNLGSDRVHF